MPEIIEGTVPLSPGWWLHRLHKELVERRPVISTAVNYYDGIHNLEYASKKFKETFGNLFAPFADNWCGIVADAVEERLNVTGFRVDATDEEGDKEAWDLWQRSQMDAQSQMAHQASIVTGVAYAVPWFSDVDGTPEMTVESPMNTIVACHPKIRRRRQAGLRVWRDDTGYEHAELFLPESVYQLRSLTPHQSDDLLVSDTIQWTVDPDAKNVDVSGAMVNPLGLVPVVELLNNPRLVTARSVGWGAHSEIRNVIPLQNAANKLFADLLAVSEENTLPARYAEGYEPDVDPVTKQPRPPAFAKGPGTFWWLEDEQAKFGQFQPSSLDGVIAAIDMTIQHIASISRTPPHYLNSSADRLSGESIKAAETGLVSKVKRKWRPLGEAWEETVRILGVIAGDPRLADAERMETIWSDPESHTESEHVDAVSKKVAIGVPWRQAMEDLDYSPEEILRMEAERASDALLQPLPQMAADGSSAQVSAGAAPA